MSHIQILRRGFPDLKFFGNSMVGWTLGKYVPEGRVVAYEQGLQIDESKKWEEFATRTQGIKLDYVSANDRRLDSIIREELETAEQGPVIINYHFPGRESREQEMRILPNIFGNDIAQVLHLHCSAEFFGIGPNAPHKGKMDVAKDLRESYEKGYIRKFIAVSYQVKDSFKGYLPEEAIEVVQNGIPEDIYRFRPEPDKEAFRRQFAIRGRNLIGFSGGLEPIKGYQDLISLISWFDKHPEFDVGFVLASTRGEQLGNLDQDLQNHAPRMLAQNRVGLIVDVAKLVGGVKELNSFSENFFLRFIDQKLKPSCKLYMGVSPVPIQSFVDVYVQPSVCEAFGLAALEAVFTGTPVVAYRVGGLPEIVYDSVSGTLVERRSDSEKRVSDFADAIVNRIKKDYGLVGDIDTSTRRQGIRELLVPKFGARTMAEKISSIYSDLRK